MIPKDAEGKSRSKGGFLRYVIVMGGLPISLLMRGSREKVYKEACKLLKEVKEPGGFIFSGSQTTPTAATKIENMWAVVEAARACGGC